MAKEEKRMAEKEKEKESAGTVPASAGHVLNTALTPREARVLAGSGRDDGKRNGPPPAKR